MEVRTSSTFPSLRPTFVSSTEFTCPSSFESHPTSSLATSTLHALALNPLYCAGFTFHILLQLSVFLDWLFWPPQPSTSKSKLRRKSNWTSRYPVCWKRSAAGSTSLCMLITLPILSKISSSSAGRHSVFTEFLQLFTYLDNFLIILLCVECFYFCLRFRLPFLLSCFLTFLQRLENSYRCGGEAQTTAHRSILCLRQTPLSLLHSQRNIADLPRGQHVLLWKSDEEYV